MFNSVKQFIARHAAALILLTAAFPAAAYIGPGSGISVIGSLLGLLATILITVGAIALFPFRKMMKRRAKEQDAAENDDVHAADTENAYIKSTADEGAKAE